MVERNADAPRESAEALAQANDQLMAKNHALAEALNRAGKELNKARACRKMNFGERRKNLKKLAKKC